MIVGRVEEIRQLKRAYPSELKFRRLAFLAGAFGFGPAVTIAPFPSQQ